MNDNTENAAPDPHTECLEVLRLHAANHGDWPQEMPEDYDAAGRWWLKIIEPPHPIWDRPKVVSSRSEHTTRTVYPYIDRATYALRIFLLLPADFQRLIVRASEDEIFWRGDTEHMFRQILHEHARMDEVGLDEYRAETRRNARRVRDLRVEN